MSRWPKMTTEECFWEKVSKNRENGCWDWTACKIWNGYGLFSSGHTVYAHRYSYELHVGPIPEGLQIDHLCRNRGCVNPDHLEPVTPQENSRRGDVGKVNNRNKEKTHCPQGHPYSGDNLFICAKGGRHCRICKRKSDRISSRRIRAEKRALCDQYGCEIAE